jgi:putative methyltransferase (TIGR04325 family)
LPTAWHHLGAYWPAGAQPGWDNATLQTMRRRQRDLLTATADVDLAGTSTKEQSEIFGALHAVQVALLRRGQSPISILDWGGGLATFYLRLRRLYPDLAVSCTVKETAALCLLGRQFEPTVRFVDDPASAFDRRYDLVIADATAFCDNEWWTTLAGLAAVTEGCLLLTRLPTVRQAASYVMQRAAPGEGAYTCRVLNESDLDEVYKQAKLRMLRRLPCDEQSAVAGAQEQPVFRSYLLGPM